MLWIGQISENIPSHKIQCLDQLAPVLTHVANSSFVLYFYYASLLYMLIHVLAPFQGEAILSDRRLTIMWYGHPRIILLDFWSGYVCPFF